MIYRIYTVRDTKAAAFAPPFFLHRDEVALRTFSDALADPQHPMSAHPGDYQLFRLGTFDDETGELTGEQSPVFLINGDGEMSRG